MNKTLQSKTLETATFASGCFWCTEAIFKRLKGVQSVVSGYIGGEMENPTYDDVTSGQTRHAEAIQTTFDPTIISYQTLLDVFFATHDPTTLNRQGADVGTQYRSAIFYHTDKQKNHALKTKEQIDKSGKYRHPVVTEIVPYTTFYTAEGYHQNYYDNNKDYPYCRVVVDPKIQKLLKEFKKEVKEEYLH